MSDETTTKKNEAMECMVEVCLRHPLLLSGPRPPRRGTAEWETCQHLNPDELALLETEELGEAIRIEKAQRASKRDYAYENAPLT